MTSFRSAPIQLPVLEAAEELTRADLVFYEVDHSGASYQALVFLDADEELEPEARRADQGYAGAFTVFGHAGCYGDEGHCLPSDRSSDEFDRRPPHPLRPFTKTLEATEAVRRALAQGKTAATVTVVSQTPDTEGLEVGEPLRFESVRLLTYED